MFIFLECGVHFEMFFVVFFCNEQKVKQETNIFIDRILSECSSIYMPQVVFGSLYGAIQSFITFAIKSNFNWNKREKKPDNVSIWFIQWLCTYPEKTLIINIIIQFNILQCNGLMFTYSILYSTNKTTTLSKFKWILICSKLYSVNGQC